MPKDWRVNSSSSNRATASPYSRESLKPASQNPFPHIGDEKEWEDTRCPICMEHPHNAVLLLCCSHDKGCRPFICDTSYRHSNCLDLFRKSSSKNQFDLLCPLCRGAVTGWKVIPSARKYMDLKTRSCSLETCSFSGNYAELRRHARIDHPCKRPSVASPTRQLNWVEMERQRDMEDALAYGWDPEDDIFPQDEFFSGDGFLDLESESEISDYYTEDQMIFSLTWPVLSMFHDVVDLPSLPANAEIIDPGTPRLDVSASYISTGSYPVRNVETTSTHRREDRRRENENASYHRVEANTRSRSRLDYYNRRENSTLPISGSSYYRRNDTNETFRESRMRYDIGSSRHVPESSRREPRPPPTRYRSLSLPLSRYRSPAGRDFEEYFRRER